MSYNNVVDPEAVSYLVYFNGIEVPVAAVQVSMGIWQIPTAFFTLAPDVTMKGIGQEDRVRATVFYLDKHRAAISKNEGPQFRLLFDGEIFGGGYQTSANSRNLSYRAMDFPSALEQFKILFMTNISNLTTKSVAPESGSTIVGGHYQPIFPASLFFKGLDSGAGDTIRRPFDFIDNMFRAMFGQFDVNESLLEQLVDFVLPGDRDRLSPASIKSTVALHWFSRWARRNQFHRRWIPLPAYEEQFVDGEGIFPILKALQSQQVIDAVNHQASRIGDTGSLWDMLRVIFQSMFYEVAMITTPSAVAVSRDTTEVFGPPHTVLAGSRIETTGVGVGEGVGGGAEGVGTGSTRPVGWGVGRGIKVIAGPEREVRLTSYFSKPQLLFSVPPACNVVFNGMMAGHNYDEDYWAQPTRVLFAEGSLFNAATGGKGAPPDLTEIINASMSAAFPPQAQRQLDIRLGRPNETPKNVLLNPHNYLVWAEEFFRGPNYLKRNFPPWFLYLQRSEGTPEALVATTTTLGPIKARTQAFVNGLRVTEDVAAKGFDAAKIATLKKQVADTPPAANDAFPSEQTLAVEWAQIVTDLEKAGYTGAGQDLTEINRLVKSSFISQPAFQLYAAYEYFRERYAKRNGASNLCFNPYIVPGFPGVLWDNNETQYHQFMYVTGVTHALSANSAGTQISYTFSRTFGDFFNELSRTRYAQQTQLGQEATRVTRDKEGKIVSESRGGVDPDTRVDVSVIDPEVEAAVRKEVGLKSDEPLNWAALGLDPNDFVTPIDAVPPNPVASLRQTFQYESKIRPIYQKLFYRNRPEEAWKNVLFSFHDQVQAINLDSGQKTPLRIEPDTDYRKLDVGFVPTDHFADINKNKDLGLQFCSRPICTLDEWIDFHNEKGVRELPVSAEDENAGKGAPYWARILNYVQGPGPEPNETAQGNRTTAPDADTRYDWERLFLRYRQKVYYKISPNLA